MPPDHMPPATPLARPRLRRHAAPGSPTLLFLHGAGCGAWVWEQGFAARFAEAGYPSLVLELKRRAPAGGRRGWPIMSRRRARR
ncbi:hypothetical protein [Pseudoroseomonas cervicalis]|uniref:hypothetical protein n=1 Tax=Teichococcus cervicalis TaxID=204525 RepID=UPI00278AFEC2|nr:hypothetical protein [Pseudoroseomonas cervicalis]MDQ1080879.1 pimeloyl-ACP methyl ester carboxylesterase [Pseudoroseomonas cervicalis]